MRPHGFYQSLALDALTVFAAALTGYFYRGFTNDLSWWTFLYAVLGFFFLAMCSVFQMLLLRNWERRVFILALEMAAIVGFFYTESWLSLLGIAAAGFLLFLWGEASSRRELKNDLEIRFFRTVRPQLSKLITGIVLMAILLYLPLWDAKKSFFSEETFGALFSWSAGLAQNFYPELTLDASVGEFARSVARLELSNQAEFSGLPSEVKEATLNQAEGLVLKSLEGTFKIALKKSDTMRHAAYGLVIDALAALQEKFRDTFLFIWAAAVFLFLRGFGVVTHVILSFSAAMLYQLFLGMNLIHIAGESRTQEVVEYS